MSVIDRARFNPPRARSSIVGAFFSAIEA